MGRSYIAPQDNRNAVISDSLTISPTMFNELRIGYSRRHFSTQPTSYNQDWGKKLGIRTSHQIASRFSDCRL